MEYLDHFAVVLQCRDLYPKIWRIAAVAALFSAALGCAPGTRYYGTVGWLALTAPTRTERHEYASVRQNSGVQIPSAIHPSCPLRKA